MRAIVKTHEGDVRNLDETQKAANSDTPTLHTIAVANDGGVGGGGGASGGGGESGAILGEGSGGSGGRGSADGCTTGGYGDRRINPELCGAVQLVLSNPPFYARRRLMLPNYYYQSLSEDELRQTALRTHQWVRPSGHVFLFFSAMQLPQWVSHLSGLKGPDPCSGSGCMAGAAAAATGRALGPCEDASAAPGAAAAAHDDDDDDNDNDDDGAPKAAEQGVARKYYEEDQRPLLTSKSTRCWASKRRIAWARPRNMSTQMTNRSQFLVHGTRNWARKVSAYRAVNHRTLNAVPFRFPAHHNVIDNVVPLRDVEVLRWEAELHKAACVQQQQQQQPSNGEDKRDTDDIVHDNEDDYGGGSGGGEDDDDDGDEADDDDPVNAGWDQRTRGAGAALCRRLTRVRAAQKSERRGDGVAAAAADVADAETAQAAGGAPRASSSLPPLPPRH